MHLFSISRFKTSWEYADVARAGWQWSYDYSASMVRTRDTWHVAATQCRITWPKSGAKPRQGDTASPVKWSLLSNA